MKRVIDLICSFVALVVFSPLLIILSITIHFKLGKPVFFRQARPGLNGRVFQLIKFRTMLDAYDVHGNALPDEVRLTPFGKFLRTTSMDELPTLWNVFKGDMSLVGPRPLLVEYLQLYSEEQNRRHEVKPGITGWAQVNGRNAISWDEKFKFDVWYVDNMSLFLDFKILLLTVKKVFVREGINADGHVTMSKFTGNSHD